MRGFCAMVMVFVWGSLSAQHLDEGFYQREEGSSVHLSLYGGYASDHLGNAFLKEFAFSEVLTRGRIDEQRSRLKGTTLIGGDYRFSFNADIRLKEGPWSFLFLMSDVAHFGGRIQDDAFAMAFYGNKGFAGGTAELGGSSVHLLRYQKVGMGARWQDVDRSAALVVSFVNGQQLLDASLERANIYTSDIGDTLRADVIARWRMTDSTANVFSAPNGGGFAIDFSFSERFDALDSRWDLSIDVRDLGWIQWHPGGEVWDVDTVIEFTGVDVGEVSDLGSFYTLESTMNDSISAMVDAWRSSATHESYLPGWLQVRLRQSKQTGIEFGMGVAGRWATEALTYAWLESGYRFNERWLVGAEIGYGGFGKTQVGVSGEFQTGRTSARIRVSNLEGLILPVSSAGLTASIGLSIRLNEL
ncbi:MAG: DUF5723 family protein [Cryomorphaceae bacterium]